MFKENYLQLSNDHRNNFFFCTSGERKRASYPASYERFVDFPRLDIYKQQYTNTHRQSQMCMWVVSHIIIQMYPSQSLPLSNQAGLWHVMSEILLFFPLAVASQLGMKGDKFHLLHLFFEFECSTCRQM